ncbi:putative nucleotidyltransferase, ribonuclease H [Tanacetum coccineum]
MHLNLGVSSNQTHLGCENNHTHPLLAAATPPLPMVVAGLKPNAPFGAMKPTKRTLGAATTERTLLWWLCGNGVLSLRCSGLVCGGCGGKLFPMAEIAMAARHLLREEDRWGLGYLKDGDGDGNSQPHKGVKASANSDVMYFFTSAQDGDPLQDDVRLCLGDDLKKAQDHSQRQAGYHYHPLHVASYPFDQIQPDMSLSEEPESILDRQERVMRNKVIPFVKILWKNHPEREATWETEESMRASYPHFFV